MATLFERRNLPEGIVVVMLFSARGNSEGNLRFLGSDDGGARVSFSPLGALFWSLLWPEGPVDSGCVECGASDVGVCGGRRVGGWRRRIFVIG